ncbi:hypothetical protein niasHT_024456 [Heterodera trifolii]|uniref:Uncharacterized protein n=1 Tax=Heterodera trifolii TaxID=157864 RepID=A0ABD2JYB5_9BILA
MTVNNYIDLVNHLVLGTPVCNSYRIQSLSHYSDQTDGTLNYLPNYQPQILGEQTIHLLSFHLRNEIGNGPDNFLELLLTETHLQTEQPDQQQQHEDEQQKDRTTIVIAPRIGWNGQRFEVFPQMSLVVYDRRREPMNMTIDELKHKVSQFLNRPINRLQNSVNFFCKIFANEVIHQKVLASLRPKDVGRMESVSVSLKNILLSESVDNAFWKVHYERLFGKVQDDRQIPYRERFGEKMRWQANAARMLMAIPLREPKTVDVPDEPKSSPTDPLSPYDPPRPSQPDYPDMSDYDPRSFKPPEPDNDPLRLHPILPAAPYAPPARPRPSQPNAPARPPPTHPDIGRPYIDPLPRQPTNPYSDWPYGPSAPTGSGGYMGGGYDGGLYDPSPDQPGNSNYDPYGMGRPDDRNHGYDGPGSSGGGGGGFFGPYL